MIIQLGKEYVSMSYHFYLTLYQFSGLISVLFGNLSGAYLIMKFITTFFKYSPDPRFNQDAFLLRLWIPPILTNMTVLFSLFFAIGNYCYEYLYAYAISVTNNIIWIAISAIIFTYECCRQYYLILQSKETRLSNLKKDMTECKVKIVSCEMEPREFHDNNQNQFKNENQMKLIELDDDCLKYLFDFLDPEAIVAVSKTCKRLNSLAEIRFKRFTSYECIIYKNVATASNVISKLGKNLRQLSITFKFKCFDDILYNYCCYSDAEQIFEVLNESIGENFTTLSLTGRLISEMPIGVLKPVFQQLESLSLYSIAPSKSTITIDLPALCPKLKTLTISGAINFAPNVNKVIKHLEEIVFLPFHDVYNRLDINLFFSFLSQNLQLKTLCIGTYQFHQNENYFNRLIDYANVLRNSDGLKIHLVSEAYLLQSLNENQLRNLNVESIIIKGRCLPFVENIPRFAGHFNWDRVKFFESDNGEWQIVVSVVRAAKNLEMVRIGLNHNVTKKFIGDIAEARHAATIVDRPPLKICFHTDVSKKPTKKIGHIWVIAIEVKMKKTLDKFLFSFCNLF